MTRPTPQEVVANRLRRRAVRIGKLEASLSAEYAERLEDFAAARALVPPVRVVDICDAAGITEEAYRASLRKAKAREVAPQA